MSRSEGNVKDVHACLAGNLHLESMVDLSQDQTTPQLDVHDRLFRAPQVIQVEMVLNCSERQLDIPSARIQFDDI